MGAGNSITLYHYTSKEGAQSIKRSKKIRASTNTNIDALFGKGVYFTSIDPYNDPESILLNNYDDSGRVIDSEALWAKIEWVIEVYFSADDVEKVGSNRDVYLYRGDIDLNQYQHHKIYQNPMV